MLGYSHQFIDKGKISIRRFKAFSRNIFGSQITTLVESIDWSRRLPFLQPVKVFRYIAKSRSDKPADV
ncbi:hypothetical protein ACROYT_G036782 [Oculina patagonica]